MEHGESGTVPDELVVKIVHLAGGEGHAALKPPVKERKEGACESVSHGGVRFAWCADGGAEEAGREDLRGAG